MTQGIHALSRRALSKLFVQSPVVSQAALSTSSCYRACCTRATDAADVNGTAADCSSHQPLLPALYIVGTPIGNLEDISFRALRVLQSVNLVLAEDTRHTRKLLQYFHIQADTLSYHQHNERQRQELVLHRLQQGEPIALVSDAGMPAISDPGAPLVAAAVAAGCKVVPVPGPCAAVTALAASGLPTDSFHFAGFLPPKSTKRCAALQQLASIPATLVFYAPPHGLGAILADMVAVLGPSRRAVVARELTKLHEEFYRGSLSDVLDEFAPDGRRSGVVKGEIVLLVEGCPDDTAARLLAAAAAATTTSRAAVQEGEPQPGLAAAAARPTDAVGLKGIGPYLDAEEALKQLIRGELLSGNTVSSSSKLLAKQHKLPRTKVYKLGLEVERQLKAQQERL